MNRRGFTLIELLVVIAIIAILAAILMPVLVSAQRAGQTAACTSNLSQLARAVLMYSDDNNGKCVPSTGWPPVHPEPVTWRWLVRPYVSRNTSVFVCPTARKEVTQVCGHDVSSSYGLNYNAFAAQGPSAWGFYPAWSIAYPHASRILMIVHDKGWSNAHCMMLKMPDLKTWMNYPHNNSNLVAFLDGHVKVMKIRDTVGKTPRDFMWFNEFSWSQPGAWHDTSKTWGETCQGYIDDIQRDWPADYGGN